MRNFLPPKNEYVLSIRLSEKQITLYKNYLVKQRGIESINSLGKVHGTQLFNDFQMLARIWTHPWILKLNDDRVQKIELKNEIKMAEKDFVVDDDDDDDLDDEVICDDNDEERLQPAFNWSFYPVSGQANNAWDALRDSAWIGWRGPALLWSSLYNTPHAVQWTST